MAITRSQDGYLAGERDPFHWVRFHAALGSLTLAALLLVWYHAPEFNLSVPRVTEHLIPKLSFNAPMLRMDWSMFSVVSHTATLIAFVLLGAVAIAAVLSDFWRRYDRLIWWRKVLIWIPSVPETAVLAIAGFYIIIIYIFFIHGRAPIPGLHPEPKNPPHQTVDADGNVHEWNSWAGWRKTGERASHGYPAASPFGGPERTSDGRQLFEKR